MRKLDGIRLILQLMHLNNRKLLSWAWLTCLFYVPELVLKSVANACQVMPYVSPNVFVLVLIVLNLPILDTSSKSGQRNRALRASII